VIPAAIIPRPAFWNCSFAMQAGQFLLIKPGLTKKYRKVSSFSPQPGQFIGSPVKSVIFFRKTLPRYYKISAIFSKVKSDSNIGCGQLIYVIYSPF
jgi:hypothetical protein